MTTDTLDAARIEKLLVKILLPIRDNYQRGPISRDRVYETLNALAGATAIAIKGADDPEALEFFSKALNQILAQKE